MLLPTTRNSHFLWGPRRALSVCGFIPCLYRGPACFSTPSSLMFVAGDRLVFHLGRGQPNIQCTRTPKVDGRERQVGLVPPAHGEDGQEDDGHRGRRLGQSSGGGACGPRPHRVWAGKPLRFPGEALYPGSQGFYSGGVALPRPVDLRPYAGQAREGPILGQRVGRQGRGGGPVSLAAVVRGPLLAGARGDLCKAGAGCFSWRGPGRREAKPLGAGQELPSGSVGFCVRRSTAR